MSELKTAAQRRAIEALMTLAVDEGLISDEVDKSITVILNEATENAVKYGMELAEERAATIADQHHGAMHVGAMEAYYAIITLRDNYKLKQEDGR